jgi:hypothetical protein
VFAAVDLFGLANLSLYHAKKAMVIESKACCRALFVLWLEESHSRVRKISPSLKSKTEVKKMQD